MDSGRSHRSMKRVVVWAAHDLPNTAKLGHLRTVFTLGGTSKYPTGDAHEPGVCVDSAKLQAEGENCSQRQRHH